MIVHEFPSLPTAEKLAAVVENIANSFFLDSSDLSHPQSGYSYAGINPLNFFLGDDNPWPVLEEAFRELPRPSSSPPFFSGGLVGYLAYENYRFLEPLSKPLPPEAERRVAEGGGPPPRAEVLSTAGEDEDGTRPHPIERVLKWVQVPAHWFGWFDPVLVIDHRGKKSFLVSERLSARELKLKADEWVHLLETARIENESFQPAVWKSRPDFAKYRQKIARIHDYLLAGDVYQVNLTERFEAVTKASAASLYNRLRRLSPVPLGAFINTGQGEILSASPEFFVGITGEKITTRPIKGTRRRSPDSQEDGRLREELLASSKDFSELLMIVDLERNDLGQVCECGSVAVLHPFQIESFAQVHHLVATVEGTLKKNVTPVQALKAVFPGGSITGAPKRRAMEIIEELEENPRGVYTGAIGFLSPQRSLFNMPIRTLTKIRENVTFHAGGGIVAESTAEAEWEELTVKASGMMGALGV